MKLKETTFYLVRHGETIWNRYHIMQGHLDSPLTELGIQQALSLRDKFRDIKFDRVLSSDLGRAIATARLITSDFQPIVTIRDLRERNYGRYDGQPASKYHAELGEEVAYLKTLPDDQRRRFRLAPDIETGQEIFDRLAKAVELERSAHPGETFLVVSHGSILREGIGYFDSRAAGLSGLFIKNGGYMKVVFDGQEYAVAEMVDVERTLE